MAAFRQAWAVVLRDFTVADEEQADAVSVVRVYWSESDAVAEVARLMRKSAEADLLYYAEPTEVEQPLKLATKPS
jgi:hypothetical protein